MQNTLEDILFPVVDSVRETMDRARSLEKGAAAPLFGEDGPLDSLTLVNFILEVEEKIESTTGKSVRLVSSATMSRKHSPFRTLGGLAEYIDELLLDSNA